MRKFIYYILLLLFGYLFVNLIYLRVLEYIDWEVVKAKQSSKLANQDYNILVMGNSTTMDGINTDLLSKRVGKAYNFSLGGASLITNYVQLQHYLDNNAHPEQVWLFLSSCHTNYLKEGSDVHPLVNHYLLKEKKVQLSELPIYKYRWLFVENIKKIISPAYRNAKVVQGQLQISKVIKDNSEGSPAKIVPSISSDYYSHNEFQYLWEITKLCQRKKIKLEVFEMPCFIIERNNFSLGPHLIINKGNTNLSIRIHNLNNSVEAGRIIDPNQDWLSPNHLNLSGSVHLTEHIVDLLYPQSN